MAFRRIVSSFACFVVLIGVPTASFGKDAPPARTALDDYIEKPDASYKWEVVSDTQSAGMRTVVIDMVSQTWRTKEEVDRPEWRHWLTLAIPANAKYDTGLLFIGGGKNGGDPPKGSPEIIQNIARATGSIAAELKMIPNQPLVFHNDGQPRVEDDLIGYTWDQYLKTGDPTWPARNPMVKSAVRAMDTITAFTSDTKQGLKPVEKFVVAGGSKRGWTTWLTGAVDDRVVAIVPIVIDVLNMDVSMRHHFAAYGFWAPAIGNYVEHNITSRMDHPRKAELGRLVDPFHYRHRLKKPKFIVNAAGDQFFLPDSSLFYFDELVGEKWLRYVPNADHSLDHSDALQSVIAFYTLILEGKTPPEVAWKNNPDGSIEMTASEKPIAARLWQANNPDARDFRMESLGPKYTSTMLEPNAMGAYVAAAPTSQKGWTAYFIELTFDVGAAFPMKVTSNVRVTPDQLPYEDADPGLPPTITLQCVAPNQTVAEQIKSDVQEIAADGAADSVRVVLGAGENGGAGDAGNRNGGAETSTGAVLVRINWTPKGRFRASAEPITEWLKKLGCSDLHYHFESGKK